MKRINWAELSARIIELLIGLAIAHLGVTLFLLSDLGSDPFNVLIRACTGPFPGRASWTRTGGCTCSSRS